MCSIFVQMEAEDRKEKKEKEQEGRNQGSEDESNHAGKGNNCFIY